MGYRFKTDLRWSDVTPKGVFLNRRQLIAGGAALALAGPALTGRAMAKIEAKASAYSTDQAPIGRIARGCGFDEAMHPLTILATGLYDKPMPNQNGAPIRLVVPWKYGFKSIKSVVKITLTDSQPVTSWQIAATQRIRLLCQCEPAG
jgi:hypothetical protein